MFAPSSSGKALHLQMGLVLWKAGRLSVLCVFQVKVVASCRNEVGTRHGAVVALGMLAHFPCSTFEHRNMLTLQ